jgi:hypothetical protein
MARLLAAILFAVQFAVAGGALACHLPKPGSEVVLVLDGMIDECNIGLEAHFDMAMLEALPSRKIATQNPWEKGVVTYEGVLLRDLLDHVGGDGNNLVITALNDYRAEIEVADARSIDVILAYKRNGAYMPVRDKGPLFVVFPFTDIPALAVESRYAQSVWQVARITVK